MNTYTEYTQGRLKCDCLIVPKQCFKLSKIPAKTLEGAVVTGRILDTRQEFVKMHLGIDIFQNPLEAYEFPWKPISGNLLYCMPEIGTKAALYFRQADESTGEVIYNIRENGVFCSDLADYNNRYFTTKYQKRITVTTQKEATFVRKDLLSPTVINLCNAFDSLGKFIVEYSGK